MANEGLEVASPHYAYLETNRIVTARVGRTTENCLNGTTRHVMEETMCKTIKQRVKFKAAPATVYDLLADSEKHTAVTGRKATISGKIGGTFSTSGNDVTGVNVDLVPGR